MNVGELPEMDPYEEVAQQGRVPPLSPAYVPNPIELDDHVEDQPYADDASPTTELPRYIADSDSMEKDLEEDPSKEHEPEDDDEDPKEDPNEEHEPEDKDNKKEEPSEGSDETEPFEENETAGTPPPPTHRGARIFVKPQTPMAASTQALIDAFAAGSPPFPLPPTSYAYDQAPLAHRTAMICIRDDIPEEDMPPQRRFMRQSLVRSLGHDARPIAKAADTVDDVGYVDALHASEHRMMTSIEEMMRIYALEARAQTDTVEDAGSSCGGPRRPVQPTRVCSYTDFMKCQPLNFKGTEGVVGLSQWLEKMESVFHISGCPIDNQVKFATCTMLGAVLTWWNGHNLRVRGNNVAAYTQRFQELALMCTKYLADETKKVDKYISGLLDNIHGNVMSARPKTLDNVIELANDLMDKKLRTYVERQNDNKRKADDSLRNNQRPHKKQNVARHKLLALVKRRIIPKTYLCAPSVITTTPGNVHPSAETARELPKTKEPQKWEREWRRAYALGGRDASPDSNIITGTFPLNNRYATILFDTGADRIFVSTTFSALIDITPTTLENHYDVELADGKIIGVNIIIRGCTLNFMNHPFNIDPMPVPLGSFDVIIGMDWLTKYHGVIICDEKIVRVPFRREMLIFQGSGNNQREESRLNIILCTKAKEYLSKGCDVFLAHITTKEGKDKSEGKRLEDVPIVRDFPEVFPKDLSGIPPARQVEFQIDLVPGATPVVWAPYWLAPSEMKELAEQLQELSEKGFIRPNSSPWGASVR
nr:putative reverse transcriptase domain-containing protein [Tanacetum cinerariifolium]